MNETTIILKNCGRCGATKPISEFHKQEKGKFGVRGQCRACVKKIQFDRYWKNPDKYRKMIADWREKNPGHAAAYYAQNIDAEKARGKAAREANPQKARERVRKYYQENREKVIARTRVWKKQNRDQSREYMRRHDKKRRSTPRGRLDNAISAGVSASLAGGSKAGRKWQSLVGYTLDDLVTHLEKQFKDGMSWDNYGEWHVDHIIPKSVFNYERPEHIDFRRAWALSNLRPLWGRENVRKRAKLSRPFQPSLPI